MSKFYTSVVRQGDNILVRGYENGEPFSYKHNLVPKLYTRALNNSQGCGLVSVDGHPLAPVAVDTMREASRFMDDNAVIPNMRYFVNTNYVAQYIADEYPEDEIEYDDALIRIFNIDIEVKSDQGFPHPDEAKYPIISICLRDSKTGVYHVWAFKPFESTRTDITVEFHHVEDERALLREFMLYWRTNWPDVVTGWNLDGFDVPYIINRMKSQYGDKFAKGLSPWNRLRERTKTDQYGKKRKLYDIIGVSILDYLDMYKKYTYENQSAYTLDHIAFVELEERKLDYSEEGTLHGLYEKDYGKFIEYNIRDVELVHRINEKLKLLEIVFLLSYASKLHYNDTFSPVKIWETLIYNDYRRRGVVVDKKENGSIHVDFDGAYVIEPTPGRYEWITAVDLDSLYPHCVMQYSLGHDSIVDATELAKRRAAAPDEQKPAYDAIERASRVITVDKVVNKSIDLSEFADIGLTLTPNGAIFDTKNRSIMSRLMSDIYTTRKEAKREQLRLEQVYEDTAIEDVATRESLSKKISFLYNKQMAYKILLNSGYGALGNEHFQYVNPDVAEAVTSTGQVALLWIRRKLDEYFNDLLKTKDKAYVIYGDTDSVVGSSTIVVNDVDITIEDYFASIPKDCIVELSDGSVVKSAPVDDVSLSYSTSHGVENKSVEYVMQHEVEKEMFEITIGNDSVIITEDHSLMVIRNDELISIKVSDVLPTDMFVKIEDT